MKNWRNISVDSLKRITPSGCRDREFLRQPDDDMRPRWQDDVRVLGLMRDSGARGTTHDAADDRALLVAAQHATEDRARSRARSHLGRITRCHAAALVDRLERVHGRLDGIRLAAYSDARNIQRQGPGRAGIGRRFHVRDFAVDGRARRNHDAAGRVADIVDDARGECITDFRGARGNRIGGLALLLSLLTGSQAHCDRGRENRKTSHKVLSVTAVVDYNRSRRNCGVSPCKYPASSVKLSVTSKRPSTISIPPAMRSTHKM